jgi:hypothetical protein
MVEVKQSRSAEETIERRQRNSGGVEADKTIKTGDGARRTFHNVHLSGGQAQHGRDHPGEPGIDGKMRGPANRTGEI